MGEGSVSDLFGEPPASVGTFFKSNSAMVAEALGHTPLDFLLIDRQHGSPTLETIESIVRAGELNGLPSIVRIEKENVGLFTNVLDLGAKGLMIPQVESAGEIDDLLGSVRYKDGRSYAMSTRAGRFGNRDRDDYVEWVNDKLVIVPQIESRAGVEHVEEIAMHDDVTAIMVGPADLAMSYGYPIGDDRVSEIVDDVFAAVESVECGLGLYVGTPEDLERYRDETGFLLYGSDVGTMTSRFAETIPTETD